MNQNVSDNPNVIFTFPTSCGNKMDLINFNVLESILNENTIFVFFQTDDPNCFYDPKLSDQQKAFNLEQFLLKLETTMYSILNHYHTTKTPILFGCSMGGYYAHLLFMRNLNRFHCISLGGFCHLKILDKKDGPFNGDKVIDYFNCQQLWDQYNPIMMRKINGLDVIVISCLSLPNDYVFLNDMYVYYLRLDTWNYIKTYNLQHDFDSWREMVKDIFKGDNQEFNDFRVEFYS